MARYLKHTSCEQCGSSDAKALYDDGSTYCFSCRRPTSSKVSPYALKSLHNNENDETGQQQAVSYPADATKDFSSRAMAWFNQYEIPIEIILKNEVYFSPSRDQVVFGFCDGEGRLVAYQARNLTPVSKAKRYYTKGDINEILPIYFKTNRRLSSNTGYSNAFDWGTSSRICTLVEDCLSSIKVASLNGLGADAMPLLGSGIGLSKLTRLRPFYDVLEVWLDSNMFHSAQNIVKQAQMLGFKARAVFSELDPKCYNQQQINEYLNDSYLS